MNAKLQALAKLAVEANVFRYVSEEHLALAAKRLRAIKRSPGDTYGDEPLQLGLALAEAFTGRGPGWIPEAQRIGCELASIYERAQRAAK